MLQSCTSLLRLSFLWLNLGLALSLNGQEICNNGIDDDGDGLIDCYDVTDCGSDSACSNFYFGQGIPNCNGTFTPPPNGYQLTVKYETDSINAPIEQRSNIYIQDMDGDSIPDIVGAAPNNVGFSSAPVIGDQRSKIQVFRGTDGVNIATFDVPNNGVQEFSQPALGDVDGDGLGDVIVVTRARRLVRFEMGTANFIWRSSSVQEDRVLSNHMSPQLADFNADGVPEIYVGNAIYNAVTGAVLVQSNDSLARGQNHSSGGDSWPIAFDIDGDGDLELVAGHRVYDVDLIGGTLIQRSFIDTSDFTIGGNPATTTEVGDGFTSIADLDGNGVVDVVVTRGHYLFAWEPSTNLTGNNKGVVRIEPVAVGTGNRAGRACIGDFTGDNTREIGVVSQNRFTLYDYTAATNAMNTIFVKIIDDPSGRTGCTLFDFEGDGNTEIVYSDEANIYIWNANGDTLAMVTAESGTRTEYPLIADVDADGQAEIIITAQHRNGPQSGTIGYIAVFEPMGVPWVNARPNWNQHGFFNTNINVDGTIPQQQQSHIILPNANSALNSFLSQSSTLDTTGTPSIPVPDLSVSMSNNGGNNIDLTNCPQSVAVSVDVCNGGSEDVNLSFPIAFYNNDPTDLNTNPQFLGVELITGMMISAGGCITLDSLNVPLTSLVGPDTLIYFLVNDTARDLTAGDFLTTAVTLPNYPLLECDYGNNIHGPLQITNCRDILLPIDFDYFETRLDEKIVYLNWGTQSEIDNSHFLVQRSADGINFETIGQVLGKGTSTSIQHYEYVDEFPILGKNYYRLQQFDYNGSYTYSTISVEVLEEREVALNVYPNPVRDHLQVELLGVSIQNATLKLINNIGQVVYQKTIKDATPRLHISVKEMAKGSYHLVFVRSDGTTIVRSVVVY